MYKELINNWKLLVLQVSGPSTVELNVNMHCEACAEQLKRKILQMRGTIFYFLDFNMMATLFEKGQIEK